MYIINIYIIIIERFSSEIKCRGIQIITYLLGHGQASDDKVNKERLNEGWRQTG